MTDSTEKKVEDKIEAAAAKIEAKAEKWADKDWGKKDVKVRAGGGGLYFVGFVGAAIYYVSQATDFWMGCLGIVKAMVWPGFLVFEALSQLGA